AMYLAAAGVGKLTLIDDDGVSLSNLQRQILYRTTDVQQLKALVGRDSLAALNPGVEITPFAVELDAMKAERLLAGADVVLEAVGATEPIKTAIAVVRKGGTVTLIGNITPKIDLNLQAVVTREIRLQGTCGSCGEYPACIDLLSRGLVKVEPFISAKAPLAEGASWFNRLYNHEPNLMKVILQP
ncbi:MAG: ThiF family adenylyltransferase, partial [Bryobacterales bacterium]|nr:ThiF family adenylyltransferase [Bryobacterales bacterium]